MKNSIIFIIILATFQISYPQRAFAGLGVQTEVVVIANQKATAERYIHNAVSRTIGGMKTIFGWVNYAEMNKLKAMEDVVAIIPRRAHSHLLHTIDHDVHDSWRRSRREIRRQIKAMKRGQIKNEKGRGTGNRLRSSVLPSSYAHDVSIDGAIASWQKGFTGRGVNIAVIDSGVDFAHPDLAGTQARQPFGTYAGWPIAFDDRSMSIYATTGKVAGTWYVDTSFSTTETIVDFSILDKEGNPITHTYTLPSTSKSGVYHLGVHPDNGLARFWYGERPAVLVVDETDAGVYDTVYVDLNDNYNFTDDKPCRKGDEISYIDSWDAFSDAPGNDGYADISGGMVYYIADGFHYVPAFDWLWGESLSEPPPIPGPGDMVAFMLDDVTLTGGAHGTLVASNIVGKGTINGRSPAWRQGIGIVRGVAKDAKIIAMGNFYEGGVLTDYYWFATLGYDGIANSGDEAQIVNISYKSSLAADNNEWDFESRFITWLNLKRAPYTTFVAASGNGMPDYGTVAAPSSSTGIDVGATTYFGSLGVFDSISGPEQIVSGDVSPFSGRGPTAVGHLAPDVVASGGWNAGCRPLNEIGDGWNAWRVFGGTSRACAVAAGNLALIYDAYKQHHNTFPTYDVARQILMSSAESVSYDPLAAGAGMVNSDRGTDIASGTYGIYISPDSWCPGNFRGKEYTAFANIVHPGERALKTFTIHNPSNVDITVSLSDGFFKRIGDYSFELTSDSKNESSYDFNRPDYLIDLLPHIPQQTELMEVRAVYPRDGINEATRGPRGSADNRSSVSSEDFFYEQGGRFNDWRGGASNPTLNVFSGQQGSFRLLVYDWKDINGDGILWNDFNGNGAVNEGEIERGEYIRFSYASLPKGPLTVWIQRPLDRVHDGLFIGLQHNRPRRQLEREGLPPMLIRIEVYFYVRKDWSLLNVSPETLTVPAESSVTFQGNLRVPRSQAPGIYEGVILIDALDDNNHAPQRTTLPVVVNVAASVKLRALMAGESITIGGTSSNLSVTKEDSGRVPVPNRRYFFLDVFGHRPRIRRSSGYYSSVPSLDIFGQRSDAPLLWRFANSHQVLDKGNNEVPLSPADAKVGIEVMNPVTDDFTRRSSPFYDPSFGPYTLGVQRSDSGMVPSIMPGLNLIATPFSVSISSLSLRARPRHLIFKARRHRGRAKIRVTSSVDLPHLHAVAYGLGKSELLDNLIARQDKKDDPSSASWTKDITIKNGGLLEVSVGIGRRHDDGVTPDLDLYVLYDANADGVFSWKENGTVPSEVIASSTGVGANERVAIRFPKDGTYRIAVHGYNVESDMKSKFNVSIIIAQGNELSITALSDKPVKANRPKTFILSYERDTNTQELLPAPWTGIGIVYIGPSEPPWELAIPVKIKFLPKTASPRRLRSTSR